MQFGTEGGISIRYDYSPQNANATLDRKRSAMNASPMQIRFRAVAMQLIADLDGRYVEMHVVTDTGQTVAIACEKDSIFTVQRHIEQMGRECPEVSSWK